MSLTLKDRVDALEREVRKLTAAVPGANAARDWRSTFGASATDRGFDEMVRLAHENRTKLRANETDVDS